MNRNTFALAVLSAIASATNVQQASGTTSADPADVAEPADHCCQIFSEKDYKGNHMEVCLLKGFMQPDFEKPNGVSVHSDFEFINSYRCGRTVKPNICDNVLQNSSNQAQGLGCRDVSFWVNTIKDSAGEFQPDRAFVHQEESPHQNEAKSIWIELDGLQASTCPTAAYTNENCDDEGLVASDYVCDDLELNCPDGVEETKETADLNFIGDQGQIKSILVKDKTRVTVSSAPRFIPGSGDFTHVFENHYPVATDPIFKNCLCINLQKMNGNTVEEFHNIQSLRMEFISN